jgi:hypothetical protein
MDMDANIIDEKTRRAGETFPSEQWQNEMPDVRGRRASRFSICLTWLQ